MRLPRPWRRKHIEPDVPPLPEVPERADEICQLKVQLHHAQARSWASILRTEEVVAENHFARSFREALRDDTNRRPRHPR